MGLARKSRSFVYAAFILTLGLAPGLCGAAQAAPNPERQARRLLAQAKRDYKNTRYHRAAEGFTKSCRLHRRAQCGLGLAASRLALGERQSALTEAGRARALISRVKSPPKRAALLAWAHNLTGRAQQGLGNLDAAQRNLHKAARIQERLAARAYARMIFARYLADLADLLRQRGQYKRASVEYQRALAIMEPLARRRPRDLGPWRARALEGLAAVCAKLGQAEDAGHYARMARRIKKNRAKTPGGPPRALWPLP